MREIYLSLKETPGYEYIEMLKEKLGRLCEAYEVDAEHFVNEFIKMFKKCIYKNDRRLAYEIWGEELFQEVREMHDNVLEMRETISALIAAGNFVPATVNEPVFTDNEQETLSEDEKLLKWELHLPERKEKFFFIGQTLLRLHRENICDEEWKRIFEITDKCADVIDTGKDQLQIEKIKYSFIQMKITDVRLQLKEVKFSKEAYSVRMQAAGCRTHGGMWDAG